MARRTGSKEGGSAGGVAGVVGAKLLVKRMVNRRHLVLALIAAVAVILFLAGVAKLDNSSEMKFIRIRDGMTLAQVQLIIEGHSTVSMIDWTSDGAGDDATKDDAVITVWFLNDGTVSGKSFSPPGDLPGLR